MNIDDIREIIKIQLTDVDILPLEYHYSMAYDFYKENNRLPDISEIMLSDDLYVYNDMNSWNSDPDQNDEKLESDNIINLQNDENNSMVENKNEEEDEFYLSDTINTDENDEPIRYNNSDNTTDGILNTINSDSDNESSEEDVRPINYMTQIHLNASRIPDVSEILVQPFLNGSSVSRDPLIQDIYFEIYPNIARSTQNQNMVDVAKVIKNIDEVPLAMYKSHDNPSSNNQCLICYDPFVSTDIIRVLPCAHILHRCCIDDYFLNKSHCCPCCAKPVVDDYVYKNL